MILFLSLYPFVVDLRSYLSRILRFFIVTKIKNNIYLCIKILCTTVNHAQLELRTLLCQKKRKMLRKLSKTGIQKAVEVKKMMKQAEEMREAIMQAKVYKTIKK